MAGAGTACSATTGRKARRAAPSDRFIAFALAAAELLVEAGPDGRVTYATGAFPMRLGRESETCLGQPARLLVAPEDRAAFDTAFALLLLRGRLLPFALHLAGPGRRAVALSGLVVPEAGDRQRLCLCFAPLPVSAPSAPAAAGADFVRESQSRLRAALDGGGASALGLLELVGPDGSGALRPEVMQEIGRMLTHDAGPDSIACELSEGRYGVLQGSVDDLTRLAARLEEVLAASGSKARLDTRTLPLQGDDGLTAVQATRALRHALVAFSGGGAAGFSDAGFDGGLAAFVAAATTRATALRRSLAERRFHLAFQPIMPLAGGPAHHFEALLRPHPTPGLPISNVQEFVTFAEAVGLSEELDWAVTDRVCDMLRHRDTPNLAWNLSGLSLQNPEFRRQLLARLDASPGLAGRLLAEITETAEIEDPAAALETTEGLRDRGVRLCLDDFGAGASALRYLRTFRVEFVKIDGSYVQSAVRSERERCFVASMVDLARTMDAQVVAERIETEAEARVMRELGVQFGQGYLFGRPGALPGRREA
ncbi:EAL domain-containing protein [Roseomonas sp. NAR14]|uniref:EAL domain-containing protein n=1 Tax=Roseomonas acroporae TaxID=2937791 RepID=A0A9X2BYA4_9PROT|nr:EAL domain-containing protein [Roseomonas acroporae]MCK8785805.1 EAL domain-containing protein [Roseomonas acroporae]